MILQIDDDEYALPWCKLQKKLCNKGVLAWNLGDGCRDCEVAKKYGDVFFERMAMGKDNVKRNGEGTAAVSPNLNDLLEAYNIDGTEREDAGEPSNVVYPIRKKYLDKIKDTVFEAFGEWYFPHPIHGRESPVLVVGVQSKINTDIREYVLIAPIAVE